MTGRRLPIPGHAIVTFHQAVELSNRGLTLVGEIKEVPTVAAVHNMQPFEPPRPDGTFTTKRLVNHTRPSDITEGYATDCVNGGGNMYRRGGAKMYHGLGGSLSA